MELLVVKHKVDKLLNSENQLKNKKINYNQFFQIFIKKHIKKQTRLFVMKFSSLLQLNRE